VPDLLAFFFRYVHLNAFVRIDVRILFIARFCYQTMYKIDVWRFLTFPFDFDDVLCPLADLFVVRRELCGGFQDTIDRCLSSRFYPLTASPYSFGGRNKKREKSR
jgi:hypothetical protein